MMTYAALFFMNLPAFVIGWAVTDLLWRRPGLRDGWIKLPLGICLGWGVASCLFFAWCMLFSPFQAGWWRLEVALALGLGLVTFWRSRRQYHQFFQNLRLNSIPWKKFLAGLAVLGTFSLLAVVMWQRADAKPYGNFDAYAVWNLRARFIFYSQPDSWREAYSLKLAVDFHADYPQLWSMILLRDYLAQGRFLTQAGVFQTVMIGVSCAMSFMAGLWILRGAGQAVVGGILLMGMPWFITYQAFQQADGLLTSYYLICLVCMLFYELEPSPGLLVIAGMSAGLGCWAKNDGLMFLMATSLMVSFWLRSRLKGAGIRHMLPFLAGMSIPLLTLLLFKTTLAPPSELLSGQTIPQIIDKIFAPQRWLTILTAWAKLLPGLGGWESWMVILLGAYLLLVGRAKNQPGGWLYGLFYLTALGYFGVYLITPYPLEWHLGYSLDRLTFHLLIPALFLLLVHTCTPFEVWQRLLESKNQAAIYRDPQR